MSKKGIGVLIVVATIFATAMLAFADYTVSPEFDLRKPITLTGTVTKIEWTDPKAGFYFDVKDFQTGAIATWGIELGNLNGLICLGWDQTTLKIGDVVTARGFLAKDGSKRANASDIEWADGRKILAEFFIEEPSDVKK